MERKLKSCVYFKVCFCLSNPKSVSLAQIGFSQYRKKNNTKIGCNFQLPIVVWHIRLFFCVNMYLNKVLYYIIRLFGLFGSLVWPFFSILFLLSFAIVTKETNLTIKTKQSNLFVYCITTVSRIRYANANAKDYSF